MILMHCLLCVLFLPVSSADPQPEVCLSSAEMELYRRIMDYRKARKLPPVPISAALTMIAQVHAEDLENNQPATGRCNLHSWSDAGKWSACCYTPDHKQASCMWEKPRELTGYRGAGYEIAHWNSAGATALSAFKGWRNSPGHDAVMSNRNTWKKMQWKAIGIGIRGQFATVWLGGEKDTEGQVADCEE